MKTELKSSSRGASSVLPALVKKGLQAPARPLDQFPRANMERRFGHDFSQVRIHSGSEADEAADQLQAEAFTVGNHVVMGAGQNQANSPKLLAHELIHVVQQDASSKVPNFNSLKLDDSHGPAEREARSASAERCPSPARPGSVQNVVQRQPLPGAEDFQLGAGTPLGASMAGSITLDGFALGKAELTADHEKRIADHAKTILRLLKDFPSSFVNVVGHTDRVGFKGSGSSDAEQNQALGKERADAVLAVLVANGVPEEMLRSTSLGQSSPVVDSKGNEPRNRRVEILFSARQRSFGLGTPDLRTPPPPAIGVKPDYGVYPNPGRSEPSIPIIPGQIPKTQPETQSKDWLKRALERDPLIRKLPDFLREKAIDGLKNADEVAAEKIIDALPLEDKEKQVLNAVVKSLLQMAKGKKFEMPTPPTYELPPSVAPQFPKAPGETIIPFPKVWRF